MKKIGFLENSIVFCFWKHLRHAYFTTLVTLATIAPGASKLCSRATARRLGFQYPKFRTKTTDPIEPTDPTNPTIQRTPRRPRFHERTTAYAHGPYGLHRNPQAPTTTQTPRIPKEPASLTSRLGPAWPGFGRLRPWRARAGVGRHRPDGPDGAKT